MQSSASASTIADSERPSSSVTSTREEEVKGVAPTEYPLRGPIDMSDLDRKFQEFHDAFANINKAFAEKLKFAMNGGKNGVDYYTHKP